MADINPNIYLYFGIGSILVITLLYSISKYLFNDPKITHIIFSIYLFFIIGSQFGINLYLSNDLCGSYQVSTVLFSIVPWLLIFGVLQLILTIFPGWLSPFSNTIGYMINSFRVKNTLNKILKEDISSTTAGSEELAKFIRNMNSDKSLILNEFSSNDAQFNHLWDVMKKGNLLQKNANEYKNALKNIVRSKDIISEFIWYCLAGILTVTASFNSIISTKCQRSASQMMSNHDDYLEKLKQTNSKESETKDRVYTIND